MALAPNMLQPQRFGTTNRNISPMLQQRPQGQGLGQRRLAAGQTPPIIQQGQPASFGGPSTGLITDGINTGFNQQPSLAVQPQQQLDDRMMSANQSPPIIAQPGVVPPANQFGQPQAQQQQQQFAPQQPQQQFGLSGSEQSLQAGLGAGVAALEQGTGSALGTLGQGFGQAQQQLGQGQQALGGNFGASAVNVDPLTGQPLFQQAAQGVGQFAGAGLQAQGLQSALSGAQGQDAFNQALIDNPLQNFLNQRGQQALANQAAASGGLGSGQFQAELQQLGQAQAGQQLQQQIQNLQSLSGQGLQAAGQQGQFLSQAGQQQGQLAGQNAQLGTQANLASAANRLGAARSQADLFGQGAGIASALAGQGAGFQFGAGRDAANLFGQAGSQLSQGRLQAGRDIAGQIGGSTSALADLASQQGGGISDIIGSGGANLANLLSGAGQLNAQQQQELAVLLANLSTGQASQLAQQQAGIGQAQAGGIIGQAAGLRSGLGMASGGLTGGLGAIGGSGTDILTGALGGFFSDKRLKNDIVRIGKRNGHNIYKWVWNNLMPIKSEIGKQSTGVMAQEVEMYSPDSVTKHESGYKIVNYKSLGLV